ncbi:hypothetical protein LPMP_323980 [Leishmania panamensis]|uniref:Uncharacterized protein n=1 Tax=Leishmania panamensis TaxID=5679 RepID=A0A088RZ58_LEIPA|nr:hypothetical protein LPMP_323980 [Leishmania panamensis]AIO01279.1 hypothetical protein LPMP_323980 [Leishmania panamensis]
MRAAVSSSDGPSEAAQRTPAAVSLTVADVNALSSRGDAASVGAAVGQRGALTPSRSVGELESVVESLLQENATLREKLQRDRRQMLRSAMDIRDLHASHKWIRQKDLSRMDGLYRENQRLREMLKTQDSTQGAVDSMLPHPPAATASRSSLQSLCSSPEVPAEVKAMGEDMSALQAEVVRLRSSLALKTQHLDDLWKHAERAECYVQDLLQKLGYMQVIVREESCSSARLSHHLESVEHPLEDIASFVTLRGRSSSAQPTTSYTTAESSFATLGRQEYVKRVASVEGV